MRVARFLLSFVLAASFLIPTGAQTTTSTQSVLSLQRALAALSGSTPTSDVTLSGSVHYIAGSDDESGTVILKALPTGEARTDLSLPSGQRSEIRANSSTGPVGAWSGPDGALLHAISQHNLFTDSSWFFPAFSLARLLNDPTYTVADVGPETRNGQTVEHLIISRRISAQGAPAGWISSLPDLSKTHVYLDSTTFLPAAVVFNTHPDRNKLINIPVEIRLSNYQQTNGVLVPLRVQQYFNNSLAFDLQLSSFVTNSGIPASTFTVQ